MFDLAEILRGVGVARFSVCRADDVDDEADALYRDWISEGRHGAMDYLERYPDVRRSPRRLLEGARSIVCCAFPYYTKLEKEPLFARYALGDDYHSVIRRRLSKAAEAIREAYGGETRICVDTAPLRERYWAERSGLGTVGRNNCLIVPGLGSYVFLGEILTTAELTATMAGERSSCGDCGACERACPTGALKNGRVDARKCLSYLTIEYRGDFGVDTDLYGRLYGCDRCQSVCPHNCGLQSTDIEEFKPREELLALTPADVLEMAPEEYSRLFRNSAVKRARLALLQRNARRLTGLDSGNDK